MITKKQKRVLISISDFIICNKYSPSVREQALIVNLKSISTVQKYLDRLQSKRYIERNVNMSRTIQILNCPEE